MPTRVTNLVTHRLSLPSPFSVIVDPLSTTDFDDVIYTHVIVDPTVADMVSDGTISLIDLGAARPWFEGQVAIAGGGTSEAISVPGALATDKCLATFNTTGAATSALASATPGADDIDLTFTANPVSGFVYVQLFRTP